MGFGANAGPRALNKKRVSRADGAAKGHSRQLRGIAPPPPAEGGEGSPRHRSLGRCRAFGPIRDS
eukprot:409522-Alexandrium_andersonii.AAC.1